MNVLFFNPNTVMLNKDVLVLNVDRVEMIIEEIKGDYYLNIKVYKNNTIFQSYTKYKTINECEEIKRSITETSNEYQSYSNGDFHPQKTAEILFDELTIL